MEKVEIVRPSYREITTVTDMFEDCKTYLESRGILQWDEEYPNQEYFETAFEGENLFILKINGMVSGAMVLDEWQTPEWNRANWTEKVKPLNLHSFCVHPNVQGGGMGGKMLGFAEDFAKEQGYSALRLDTYSGNEAAVRFYEKRGYQKTGEVIMNDKPEGHERYICFEKLL